MIITIAINNQAPKWEESMPKLQEIAETSLNDFLSYFHFSELVQEVELSLLFTEDDHIRQLNKQFRNKDKATNVLSFPAQEIKVKNLRPIINAIDYLYLGDIAFSLETIAKEAHQENKGFLEHFSDLLVHSMLHLIGYDHEEEEEEIIMQQLEIALLARIGIRSPYNI